MATLGLLLLLFSSAAFSTDLQPVFKGSEKMGPDLRRRWSAAMQSGGLGDEVSCLVKMDRDVDKEILLGLRRSGFDVRSVLKTVVAGRIDIGDLPYLVALDSVKSVTAGRRLFLK